MNNAQYQKIKRHSKCLFTSEEITNAITQMAVSMNARLQDSDPIFISVMHGASLFFGHLMAKIDIPCRLDYCHATRYMGDEKGQDNLQWITHVHENLEDQHVVLVDDILDEGITLKGIADRCSALGAQTVQTAVLLSKPISCRAQKGIDHADWVGLTFDSGFVYGFGLDFKHYCRNIDGIYIYQGQD